MIKGAIFDLDGTILDSMSIWDNAAEMYLSTLGIEAEAGLSRIMFTMSMTEGAEFLKNRYCLDLGVEEIVAGVVQTIEKFYYFDVQLKEGVKQFLEEMKQAGIKIVAATSSDRLLVERALKRLSVLGYFDRIFTCAEIGAGKEKPDIYLAAARFMGTMPGHTWVFEDALYAIKTARKAGFKTVGVYDLYSEDDLEEIKKISDIYFEKLDNFKSFLDKAAPGLEGIK